MAGSKGNYLEDMVLNTLFRGGNFTKPATVYVGLHSADPTDAGTGTELSGGGYARAAVTNVAGSFTAPVNASGSQQVKNAAEIAFPESSGAQGNATHFAIWTASTGGSLLYHGDLNVARNVDAAGITIKIPASQLTISEG